VGENGVTGIPNEVLRKLAISIPYVLVELFYSGDTDFSVDASTPQHNNQSDSDTDEDGMFFFFFRNFIRKHLLINFYLFRTTSFS